MRTKITGWLFVGLVATFLWACNNDDDDKVMLEQPDLDYLNRITEANLAEIEWSKIGKDSATNTAVILYADQMITEYQRAQVSVDSLATVYQATLTRQMDTLRLRLRDTLRTRRRSREYDTLYLGLQIRLHETLITQLMGAAANGKVEGLRTMAARQLEHTYRHRDSAVALKGRL
jgi:predicted outer membrane protein